MTCKVRIYHQFRMQIKNSAITLSFGINIYFKDTCKNIKQINPHTIKLFIIQFISRICDVVCGILHSNKIKIKNKSRRNVYFALSETSKFRSRSSYNLVIPSCFCTTITTIYVKIINIFNVHNKIITFVIT